MSTGRVKELSKKIKDLWENGAQFQALSLMRERDELLTNGHRIPFPQRYLNQRQRRKRARQINSF